MDLEAIKDIEVEFEVVPSFYKSSYLNEKIADVIIKSVCKHTNHDLETLKGKSRIRHIVEARQLIMYFLKNNTTYNLTKVGRFVERNHATVIHAEKQIEDLMDVDKNILMLTNKINEDIKSISFETIPSKQFIFNSLLDKFVTNKVEKNGWKARYRKAI